MLRWPVLVAATGPEEGIETLSLEEFSKDKFCEKCDEKSDENDQGRWHQTRACCLDVLRIPDSKGQSFPAVNFGAVTGRIMRDSNHESCAKSHDSPDARK
jgi:hypothetical protein